LADRKIVCAVPWSRVNATGPRFPGCLVFKANIKLNLAVGFAERDVFTIHYQRNAVEPSVSGLETVERRTFETREFLCIFEFTRLRKGGCEFRCNDIDFFANLQCRVLEIGMNRDTEICRQCPWGRCPDDNKYIL